MANPTAIEHLPAVLQTTTGEQSVTLDPRFTYGISHDKEDNAGTADTNTIYISVDAAVDADASEGADKAKLISGRSMQLPPGASTLKFKCAAGSPTFTIVPGQRWQG